LLNYIANGIAFYPAQAGQKRYRGIAQNLKPKVSNPKPQTWNLGFEIWGLGSWNLGSAGYALYLKLKCNNLNRSKYNIL